jgi:CheY-like chemotaxis protein
MTLERKKILRYGVALDAVLLVTGFALNFAAIPPLLLIVLFSGAVALGAWRGGWGPALAALAFALISIVIFFHPAASAGMLALLIVTSLAAGSLGVAAHRRAGGTETAVPPETAEPSLFHEADFGPTPGARADGDELAMDRHASLGTMPEVAADLSREGGGETTAHAASESESSSAMEESPYAGSDEPALATESIVSPEDVRERKDSPAETPPPMPSAEPTARSFDLPSTLDATSADDEASRRQLEARLAANRALIEETSTRRAGHDEQSERAHLEQRASERLAAEREEAERAFQERLDEERAAIHRRLADQLATERAAMEREAAVQLAEERRAAQEAIDRQLQAERATLRGQIPIPPLPPLVPGRTPAVPVPSGLPAEPAAPASASDLESDARPAVAARPPAPVVIDSQTLMTARGPIPKRPLSRTQARPSPAGLFGSLWSGASSLFGRSASRTNVNLRSAAPMSPSRAAVPPVPRRPAEPRPPRLLFIERRRAMADTVVPGLRDRKIEAEVVERWIDAIDEMFRFRPDALLVDVEIPEYQRLLNSLTGPSSALPVFLTGRSRPPAEQVERIPNVAFLTRPYDVDELVRAVQQLQDRSRPVHRRSSVPLPTRDDDEAGLPSVAAAPAGAVADAAEPQAVQAPESEDGQESSEAFSISSRVEMPASAARSGDDYLVECFNCSGIHDAMQAEWCSCLTKERSLVCANCLTCFCKAPPRYKEKFWLDAPPSLFERKSAELKRQLHAPAANLDPDYVARPLILLVEDDEDIQVIVERVAAKLGYGFITASNGQEGLAVARLYKPDLILSDAFMPKLDGREMCRILREEPGFESCRMVVMTGLYTDTKYRSEALKRFKIDEYISKPVAVGELVALLQRHFEGVPFTAPDPLNSIEKAHRRIPLQKAGMEGEFALPAGSPPPANSLPETGSGEPQRIINDLDEWPEESIALSDLMADSDQAEEIGFEILESVAPPPPGLSPDLVLESLPEDALDATGDSAVPPKESLSAPELENEDELTRYEVCCFSCAELFDAAHAEWCNCLGRDQTLVCSECGNCFCKAPSLYKERFWIDAPPILFERKTLGSRRNADARENQPPDAVKRPLVLLVEDDENIQLIVRTVVTTLGYGYIVAADGQEGLVLAQAYKPELILSDAFMPKLDGREMCRLLKANPITARSKAIIMTGLYTDRKYRNEAYDYFKVDDYVAKPLAVDDLMQLLRKHLPAEVQPTM